MRLVVEPLTAEDVATVHACALDILENVGVEFAEEEALQLFRRHGARVDGARVFVPARLVHWACRHAPRSFSLLGRNRSRSVVVGREETGEEVSGRRDPVFAPSGGAVFVVTPQGERRRADRDDCIRFVKLVQGSPHLQVNCGAAAVPHDVPVAERYAFMMTCSLWYSDKPVHGFADGAQVARDTIELARLALGIEGCGSPDDLPGFVIATVNPTSPLRYDASATQGLLSFAQARQPLVVASCGMMGSTVPVTLAGSLAVTHAEVLAGIVLAQIACPGTPVVYGNLSCPCDMRTLAPAFGAPETPLLTAASAQMSRWLGLPFRGGGSLTDAECLDVRASCETALNLLFTVASQADFVLQGLGVLASTAAVSYEKFMFDEDILSMLLRLRRGFSVDGGRMGLDLVREGAEKGSYLQTPSTRAFFRGELWLAGIRRDRAGGNLVAELQRAWHERLQNWSCEPLGEDGQEALKHYYRLRFGRVPDVFAP